MAAFEEIAKILEEWGEDLVKDLKINLQNELTKGRGRRVQEEDSLIKEPTLTYTQDGLRLYVSMNDYWKYLERGVDGTERSYGSEHGYTNKKPSGKHFGKKWQTSVGITNPQKILLELEIKYKGINSRNKERRRSLRAKPRDKKRLSYDKAAKALGAIIARSVFKKGLRPKPFIKKTLTEQRKQDLKDRIAQAIKQDFELIIELPE